MRSPYRVRGTVYCLAVLSGNLRRTQCRSPSPAERAAPPRRSATWAGCAHPWRVVGPRCARGAHRDSVAARRRGRAQRQPLVPKPARTDYFRCWAISVTNWTILRAARTSSQSAETARSSRNGIGGEGTSQQESTVWSQGVPAIGRKRTRDAPLHAPPECP
jgi:hypothetical protein